MSTKNPKSRPAISRYVRVLLFLALGYAACIPLWRYNDDMEWLGEFMNEGLAWALILSGFDILAIVAAIRMFAGAPIFSVVSICLAIYPLAWSWFCWYEGSGLGPSSKEDENPYGEMIGFWLFGGGGEVILFVLLPLAALYFYLCSRERRAAEPPVSA